MQSQHSLHHVWMGPRARAKRLTKRLTVAFDVEDLDRLDEIRTTHRPEMSRPYVIQYAVHQLVERLTSDDGAVKVMGDPLRRSDG